MKLKYYMRGLGLGILLTTLILAISNPKEKMTDREIMDRAGELGMGMKEEDDNLNEVLSGIMPSVTPSSELTITPSVSKSPTVTVVPTPSIEPEVTPIPEMTQAPEVTVEPLPTVMPEEEQADEAVGKEITFTIKRGMSSGKVAKLLKEKGLITDDKEFNEYITEAGKEGDIRIGTYTLTEGASYDEIVDNITQ